MTPQWTDIEIIRVAVFVFAGVVLTAVGVVWGLRTWVREHKERRCLAHGGRKCHLCRRCPRHCSHVQQWRQW